MDIDLTDANELVAYQRGVKRPQFLAGIFRFFGILVVTLSLLGIVVGIVTAGNGGGDITYSVASLFSGLFPAGDFGSFGLVRNPTADVAIRNKDRRIDC